MIADLSGLAVLLNNDFLPDHAGTSRLQLLHHVHQLLGRFETGWALVYGILPKPRRPENFDSLPDDERIRFYREDDLQHYECVRLEVEWLRRRLAELSCRLGLPQTFVAMDGVSPEDTEMQVLEYRTDNVFAFWNRARGVRNKSLRRIVENLHKLIIGVELPERWEAPDLSHLPWIPVNDRASLIMFLQDSLDEISLVGPESQGMLLQLSRALRNTRRVVKQFIETPDSRIEVMDTPASVFDAEREIERLIGKLPPDTMFYNDSASNLAKTHSPVPDSCQIHGEPVVEVEIPLAVSPPRRARGKPRKHDPREMEIVTAWRSKEFKTIADLVEGLGVAKYKGREPVRRVELIIERNRKRSKRAEKASGQNRTVNSGR